MFDKAIPAGIAGDKLSRIITRTEEVSFGRSAIAVGAGGMLGASATGAVAIGAGTLGATALAAVLAPSVIPVALASAAIAGVCSLFE